MRDWLKNNVAGIVSLVALIVSVPIQYQYYTSQIQLLKESFEEEKKKTKIMEDTLTALTSKEAKLVMHVYAVTKDTGVRIQHIDRWITTECPPPVPNRINPERCFMPASETHIEETGRFGTTTEIGIIPLPANKISTFRIYVTNIGNSVAQLNYLTIENSSADDNGVQELFTYTIPLEKILLLNDPYLIEWNFLPRGSMGVLYITINSDVGDLSKTITYISS